MRDMQQPNFDRGWLPVQYQPQICGLKRPWENNKSCREACAGAHVVSDIASRLEQQQVIKGLKDVNAGLVDGAHLQGAVQPE